MKTPAEDSKPRLYVGTYAKYNAGNLHGKWLTLTDFHDKDEFLDACRELHKDEADPELMFQDCENIPKGLYSESTCPDLWEILDECKRHGVEFETLTAWVEHGMGDYDDAQNCADSFRGQFDNEEAFAEHLCEDCGILNEIPENLRCYFDMKAYARDLFISDYTAVETSAGILVFC